MGRMVIRRGSLNSELNHVITPIPIISNYLICMHVILIFAFLADKHPHPTHDWESMREHIQVRERKDKGVHY